jgi:homoserine kinase
MPWKLGVPATIANLGPGFDILALAIDLENAVVVTTRDDTSVVVEATDGSPAGAFGDENLIAITYREVRVGLRAGSETQGVHLRCTNRVPMGRGLGSSAAAILTGIVAAHLVARDVDLKLGPGNPAGDRAAHVALDWPAIVECAERIEGHPDNVAAAAFGGLVITSPGAALERMDLPPDLRCVIYVPTEQSSTPESRAAVPRSLSREDAVFNAGRVGLLIRAMLAHDPAALGVAMEDRWHQPQRARFFPALKPVIDSALRAGAYGACLAGAGPSMLALSSPEREQRVATAMTEAAAAAGVPGSVLITGVRNRGVTVEPVS